MRILTAEDIDYEEEDETIYCPICENRGYLNRLGPKILGPNEPRPDDYDSWLQCPACDWLCPIFAVEKEETIKDMVETSDSPFEYQLKIVTVPTRLREQNKQPRGKRTKKDKSKLHEDPEIDALMRRHGDNLKVVFDSSAQ
jgi:hypothetical protein